MTESLDIGSSSPIGARLRDRPKDRSCGAVERSETGASVLASLYGEGEKRQLRDFRRSGAVEATVGDASVEDLGHAMGNTLATSNKLFQTYVPVNIKTVRQVAVARRKGRLALRAGNE